jgi:chorismate-pyruvate lyase
MHAGRDAVQGQSPWPLRLHQSLLKSNSATEVIADLCGGPVVIRRLVCDEAVACPGRDLLSADTVCHRRVMLLADGVAVSEADLWYVPARLTQAMAATLTETDTPFGIVVRPLRPTRELLSARFSAPGEAFVLEHEALLRDAAGRPLALVMERYLAQRP